jgi:L-malate glycosyltransferase
MSRSKVLNILHFPIWYPNKKNLSQGIFIQRHINAISTLNNCCVLFITSNTNSSSELEIVERSKSFTEIRVYFKKPFSGFLSFLNVYFYINGLLKGFKKAREIQPRFDIFHHHIFDKKMIFNFFLAKFYKAKFVFSEQWSGYYNQDGRFYGIANKLIARLCISGSNAITTVSQSLANAMQNHSIQGNYFVIPNVVNVQEFHIKKIKTHENKKPSALHVSAINDKEKNVSGMLRAVKNVIEKYPDFELNIIGEHAERKKLEHYSKELGIEKNVHFLGYVPSDKILSYFHHADFFLLFSHFETFSCVLAEALCSGIPVVATNSGGIPEFVNSKNGILVEPSNELELQNAIIYMIQKSIEFIPDELNKSIIDYVNPQSVAKKFNNVYSIALND